MFSLVQHSQATTRENARRTGGTTESGETCEETSNDTNRKQHDNDPHSLPGLVCIRRIPSSLSLTSLSTLVCGFHVYDTGTASSQHVVCEQSKGRAATHLVRLPQRRKLVAEQLADLRVLDNPAQSPREKVRVAAVARVERHAERRRARERVERCRRLGQARCLEVVANRETARAESAELQAPVEASKPHRYTSSSS